MTKTSRNSKAIGLVLIYLGSLSIISENWTEAKSNQIWASLSPDNMQREKPAAEKKTTIMADHSSKALGTRKIEQKQIGETSLKKAHSPVGISPPISVAQDIEDLSPSIDTATVNPKKLDEALLLLRKEKG